MKRRTLDFFAIITVFVTGFFLYFRSLGYDLTFLDDNVWLKDYHWYLKDGRNLFKVFLKPDVLFGGLFYRPLIYFTFILDTQIHATSYFIYHLTNIILHCFNGCLVYCILRQLRYDQRIVAAVTLIFTVHPVLTQAVVWIPGRTDSLLALCVFSSFVCYISFLENRRYIFLVGHVLGLVLALLTKETAIVLPVMCFLYSWSYRVQLKSKKIYVGLILIWICVSIGYFWARHAILQEKSNISMEVAITSVWNNLPAIIGYVGKIFYPVNLSVLPILKDINLMYGWICLTLLTLFVLMPVRKDYRRLLFGIGWFSIFILPSLVGSFLKHEYRVYVPLLGMLIVILELNLVQIFAAKFKRVSVLIFFGIVGCLFVTTWNYAPHYRGHLPFWENAAGTSPHSPLAHRNLGAMYFLDKKYDQAEKEFLTALELNPKEAMVYNNLGLIYERKGDKSRAEWAYLNEVVNNPQYDNVYYNLGLFYGKQHKYDKAVQMWSTATQLNPRHLMAHKYLAVYFAKTQQEDKSNFHLRELLKRGVVIPENIEELIR